MFFVCEMCPPHAFSMGDMSSARFLNGRSVLRMLFVWETVTTVTAALRYSRVDDAVALWHLPRARVRRPRPARHMLADIEIHTRSLSNPYAQRPVEPEISPI